MIDVASFAPRLVARGDGLYVADRIGPVHYPPDGNAACLAVEDESFWFSHRNDVIVDAVTRHPPGGWLLEVGGGNGAVARALNRAGYEVALLEPGAAGIAAARARGLAPLLQATIEDAALRAASVPAVGLFDVLEHVADDAGLLTRLRAALVPAGRLYLTVPAFPWLWSRADVDAGHFRRYTPVSLARALSAAGLEVEALSCFFSFLAAPILIGRTLRDRLRPKSPRRDEGREHHPPRWTQWPVSAATAAERAWLARGLHLPIGSSLLAIARAP